MCNVPPSLLLLLPFLTLSLDSSSFHHIISLFVPVLSNYLSFSLQRMIKSGNVDAVICFGVLIRGGER